MTRTTTARQEGGRQFYKKALELAVAGGAAFWATNFAISLTPIAAEYRAALSISYFPMLLEALVGGLVIGFCVSYFLLRFFERIPTKNSILKSVMLSLIVLIVSTVIIEVPATILTTMGDALRYFLIATMINALRIPALGIAIGYLYTRISGPTRDRQYFETV
jgi:hypothetical protein